MMKRFRVSLFLLFSCVFCLSAAAQQASLSPKARFFAQYLASRPAAKAPSVFPDSVVARYGLEFRRGEYWLDALLLLEDDADVAALARLGLRPRTRAGNILTAGVPAARFAEIVKAPGLRYFEWARAAEPALKEARAPEGVNVDPVHLGEGLDRAYEGEGVVVGVIDLGFHYSHVTFYDDAGETLRLTRVWDQEQDRGAPPEGYDYGMELAGQQALELNAIDASASQMSHGTHVAGIAGGSGLGTGGACRGIAPKSELVFVSTDFTSADVVDAVNYIFEHAEAQNKPAVVNMSFRFSNEPLDGTALLDQALDALQGPGKILVGGMGNEGDNTQHLRYEFDSAQDTLRTIVYHPTRRAGFLNIWGEAGAKLQYGFALVNRDGQIHDMTELYDATDQTPREIELSAGFRSIYIEAAATPEFETNGRPYVAAGYQASTSEHVLMLITVSDGELVEITTPGVHMIDYNPWTGARIAALQAGDNWTSGGAPGASARNVLGAGGYTTKNTVRNIFDLEFPWPTERAVNDLASFSSRGPTFDGRLKPDIVAPGSIIASSVSSFDRGIESQFMEYQYEKDNVRYSYALSEGTSMAAPMVSGAAALFLEINPELTVEAIRELLARTARQDEFTGPVGPEGSNAWGYGKLDINAAARDLLMITGARELTGQAKGGFYAYPNPAAGALRLHWPERPNAPAAITLSSLEGRELRRVETPPGAEPRLDAGELAAGVYLLRAECGGRVWTQKVIVAR